MTPVAVTCTAGLCAPVLIREAGEKDEPADGGENQPTIITAGQIMQKNGSSINRWQ